MRSGRVRELEARGQRKHREASSCGHAWRQGLRTMLFHYQSKMSLALLTCGDGGFSCAKSTGASELWKLLRTSTAISQNGFIDILALLRSTLDCIRTGVREASELHGAHMEANSSDDAAKKKQNKNEQSASLIPTSSWKNLAQPVTASDSPIVATIAPCQHSRAPLPHSPERASQPPRASCLCSLPCALAGCHCTASEVARISRRAGEMTTNSLSSVYNACIQLHPSLCRSGGGVALLPFTSNYSGMSCVVCY